MAGVRCPEVQSRPREFLDVTSVTVDELPPLVPPCEAAVHARRAAWRLAGTPRTARRVPVDTHCPLPTPAERLFFRRTSLTTSALQGGHGRLCGMGQGQAPQRMHVLWPTRLAALRALGAAPTRALTALAPRLGVSETAVATRVTPRPEDTAPMAAAPAAVPGAPLVPMTARRIVRPPGPAAPMDGERGKTTDQPVHHVLLVPAPRTMLLLSEPSGGRLHAQRIAEAPPSPLPAGRRWWQAWGGLAFPLPQVALRLPTRKPRGQERTRQPAEAHQALHPRRLRIEPVTSSGPRCRSVKDRRRRWKDGVRDLVMERCGALQNFRVCLTPWQPMVEAG